MATWGGIFMTVIKNVTTIRMHSNSMFRLMTRVGNSFAISGCSPQRPGLKGVIILFDEFENMLSGLKRSDYKVDAFWNLLQFGRQKQFPGLSVFAITPEFFQTLEVHRR